jgi:methyltransferase (TIGR00027 family)
MKPVSRTAYYCCGIRALDARSRHPVCGDTFAERFIDDDAARAIVEKFRRFRAPNVGNVARHRIIDDLLRERLATTPDCRVLLIGTGFDTRAYRLAGGRWVEFDEPELVALKNARLPAAEARNELTRVPIAFDAESLAERLAPFADASAIVVVEGVLVYLREAQVRGLARAVRETYDRPTLICDVMTRAFFEHYGRPIHRQLAELGARFVFEGKSPLTVIESEGFRAVRRESIVGRAAALGMFKVPRRVLDLFPRTLRDGYTVATLEVAHPSSSVRSSA